MKRSIFLKIFGSYFFIIILLTALILLVSYSAIRKFCLDSLSQDLEHLGQALKLEAVPLIEDGKFEELDAFVKSFGKSIDTRITIITREGKVLADSEEDPRLMDDHSFRPEVIRAMGGYTGRSVRFSDTVKQKMLYVGLPIEKEGEIQGVLRVSLFIKDINRLLHNLSTRLWPIFLFIVVFAMGAAFVFTRTVSGPLGKLKSASHQIASGDFDTKVYFRHKNDFKDLADSFNLMTDHIKKLFAELSLKKEQLNRIFISVKEALFILDKDNRILLNNRNFEKITESSSVEGKYYWEIIRDPKFDTFIQDVRTKKKGLEEEIFLGKKTFLCSASYLSSTEEIVIVLYDITHIKNVEKIKKDFVANVSHELKTPLTAIKGFVETLEEEFPPKKGRDYLKIIRKHTDRLINIINDLLLLSQMEEKDLKYEKEEVNIKELIKHVLKIFEQKIKGKGLDVECSITSAPVLVHGDPFRLEQLFINLIDNAVKYTEKGKIGIEAGKDKGYVSIVIKDTGIGIPVEHLSRIFERFYVVDKSRSRMLGGTGLGLSIVKHIALMHNGKVKVESTLGKGTTFRILLPASTPVSVKT